jgi:hypothetical protein
MAASALDTEPGDLLGCSPDAPFSAARLTCRISISYAAISENDGHAATTPARVAGIRTHKLGYSWRSASVLRYDRYSCRS